MEPLPSPSQEPQPELERSAELEAERAPAPAASKRPADPAIVAVVAVAGLAIAYLGLTAMPKQTAGPAPVEPTVSAPMQAQTGPAAPAEVLVPYLPADRNPEPARPSGAPAVWKAASGPTARSAVEPCTTGCAAKLDPGFSSDNPLSVPSGWNSTPKGGRSWAPEKVAFPETHARSPDPSALPKQKDCEAVVTSPR